MAPQGIVEWSVDRQHLGYHLASVGRVERDRPELLSVGVHLGDVCGVGVDQRPRPSAHELEQVPVGPVGERRSPNLGQRLDALPLQLFGRVGLPLVGQVDDVGERGVELA